jgi:H+-transporting ATPase
MERTILDAHKLIDSTMSEEALTDRIEKCDGFAQVIPEHKYRVVELLQNRGYLVGMTGDGVNDAPALKKANVGIAVAGCTDAARSAADIVLMAPGLNTIVDGVKTSRAIFQRMRSYSVYRITSTIHFLIFFFITILAFGFTLPDRLIILIAVLNDAATLVISVDNAKISKRPDKWRLGQLLTLSFILGILLMGASFAHFFVTRDYFHKDEKFVQTVMYLQMSSAPHFVIFSTRVPSWFWESTPSLIFIIAVGGTQVFAMFMSIYGVDFFEAVPIGWDWGITVLLISVATFMILDVVKVMIIRYWSFEMTAKLAPLPARRRKLASRKERAIVLQRINENVAKIRHTVRTVNVLMAWMGPKFTGNTKVIQPAVTTVHH